MQVHEDQEFCINLKYPISEIWYSNRMAKMCPIRFKHFRFELKQIGWYFWCRILFADCICFCLVMVHTGKCKASAAAFTNTPSPQRVLQPNSHNLSVRMSCFADCSSMTTIYILSMIHVFMWPCYVLVFARFICSVCINCINWC